MGRPAVLLACACLALVAARPASAGDAPEPSTPLPQTQVYYNARIALRDGRPHDVLRLWLLRNALARQGEVPAHDGDFRSAVWVALAAAGLCFDGVPDDDDADGANLWPLALHNWLVRSTSKQPPPEEPNTFSSFSAGFQQRRFSLYDVLSVEELRAARFTRGFCLRPYLTLPTLDTLHWLDLEDRLSVGITMRDLLERSRRTLRRDRVRGDAVLETRLFDLDLALGRLARAAVRRETGLLGQIARTTGVSEAALTLLREERLEAVRKGEYTELLRRALAWDELDWFSLSEARRVSLFRESLETHGHVVEVQPELRRAFLQNVDALITRERGTELEQWLGFLARPPSTSGEKMADAPEAAREPTLDLELVRAVALGERGERLLALTPAQGFREGAAVALWRGTDALERGELLSAMRAFALAMRRAEESRAGDATHRLAKRWFAYVLAQHQADEESLALLREFVPPLERNELLEVLLWRAAFHADEASFTRVAASARRGGALDQRIGQLAHLARGDAGAMWRQVREDAKDNPHHVYRFVKQLTEELATEPLDVRARNQTTLRLAKELLLEIAAGADRGLAKRVHEQLERMQTLLDGIALYDESAEGRARAAAPGAEAYAGSLRLAPADPLPWPFVYPTVQPPSPFAPLQLTPLEWLDDEGARVFGWYIHER